MDLVIDKEYDKNGNEIARDYRVKDFPELSEFLSELLEKFNKKAMQSPWKKIKNMVQWR